jgi:hypothetical protein
MATPSEAPICMRSPILQLGTNLSTLQTVGLSRTDRRRHLDIIGQTGTGKTTLIENLIRQDLERGDGLAFIDPHGDASRDVLRFVPKQRINRVIFLDPTDHERPVPFNPLHNVAADQRDTAAENVMPAFKGIWDSSWGPNLERLFLFGARALLDVKGTTLLGLWKLINDECYRTHITQQRTNPLAGAFWTDEFPQWIDKAADIRTDPVMNKIERVLFHFAVRNVLCQPNSIDLRRVLDSRQILVASLPKGLLGASGNLIGTLLVSGISQAALARADSEHRPLFNLYVDEFKNFATDSFADILSEARKYGLSLALAHQFVSQIPDRIMDAVWGNVGSFIAFRVGEEDSEIVARYLGWQNPSELQFEQNYRAFACLLRGGSPSEPIRLVTGPLPTPAKSYVRKIVSRSRHRRGGHRTLIEQRIKSFLRSGPKLKQKRRSSR